MRPNKREFYWYGSEESQQAPGREPRGYSFWPTQVLDQLMVFFLVLSVVASCATLAPIHALVPADPLTRPEALKPQWYFLPVYQLTHYLPRPVVATLVVLLVVLVVLWPFLDQATETRPVRPGRRRLAKFVMVVLLALGVLGYWSDANWLVLGNRVHVDARGVPHRLAAAVPAPAGPAAAPPTAVLPPVRLAPLAPGPPLIGQSSAPGAAPPGPPPMPMSPPPGPPPAPPTQP